MKITRDNISGLTDMEIAQILGTFWCMINSPESQPFLSDTSGLRKAYELVKDENLKRFGVDSVHAMLASLQQSLDLRKRNAPMFRDETRPRQTIATSAKNISADGFYLIQNAEDKKQFLHSFQNDLHGWMDGELGAAIFTKTQAESIVNDPEFMGIGVLYELKK